MFRKQVPWGKNITIIISNLQIDICYRGWDALNEDLEKNSEKWSFFPKVKYFFGQGDITNILFRDKDQEILTGTSFPQLHI